MSRTLEHGTHLCPTKATCIGESRSGLQKDGRWNGKERQCSYQGKKKEVLMFSRKNSRVGLVIISRIIVVILLSELSLQKVDLGQAK